MESSRDSSVNDNSINSVSEETERGVVFMTRVPPRMTVPDVRSIFSKIGHVDRIWLEPEDAESRKFRIKAGGSRRRRSKYGWIEFLDKEKAKLAVDLLHNQPIGACIGNRRKPFSEDLWSLRYLKGFKWQHLNEEKDSNWKYRNRRLNLELSQMARERDFYLSRVERAKALARIQKGKPQKRSSKEKKSRSQDRTSTSDEKTEPSTSSKTLRADRSIAQCHSESNSNIDQVLHKIFR